MFRAVSDGSLCIASHLYTLYDLMTSNMISKHRGETERKRLFVGTRSLLDLPGKKERERERPNGPEYIVYPLSTEI